MPYKNLRPSEVILDPENPRLPDGTANDREAINRLLDDGADALINLARSMAKTGQTNPAELPIAVKEGSKYLILEGNRRFAALKLLKDPDLANEEEHRQAFRRAARLGVWPNSVYTLVAESREEADPWIVLRHTGANNGVGVKNWSAGQTATHRRRANKSIDAGTARSMIMADALEEAYASDQHIVGLVRQIRRGKLTNIGRFFSPDVLRTMHFEIRADDSSNLRERALLVRHSSRQLRNFFAWALEFIRDNSVDSYKNAQVRKLVLGTVAHLIPSGEGSSEPFRLAERPPESTESPGHGAPSEGDDGPSADSNNGASRSAESHGGSQSEQGADSGTSPPDAEDERKPQRRAEARPERYLLQELKLPGHPERIQRLLKECRSLDLTQFPGVACVMARVIVELSVSTPKALQLSGVTESASLKAKIIAMLKYLDPQIEHSRNRNPDLAQAYLEADELGVQYLNGFVHNSQLYPDQHLARRFSSAFRPLLIRVDEAL